MPPPMFICQKIGTAANLSPPLRKIQMSTPSTSTSEETEHAAPYRITEDMLKKRIFKPEYGRISTQLYAGILACLSSISFGTALGWSGPVTHYLFKDKDEKEYITTKNFSLLVSMVPLGCFFGIGSTTFLMKQMGPKRALVAVAPFYIITWFFMLISKVDVQIGGRFFLGFLGMTYSMSGERLLHETVHYAIRRYVSVLHASAMLLGVFMSNITGTSLNAFWLTVICGSIPVLHLALLLPAPESPVFLYQRSTLLAAKSLAWYRGEGNFAVDMAQIRKDWNVARLDSDSYQYMLFAKVVYKGLLIVIGVTFFQVCSGYYIFLFYNIQVWTNGRVINTSVSDATTVAALFVFSRMFWGALHSVFTWKVRGLLLASCLMTSVELSLLSIFLYLDQFSVHLLADICWFPLVILAVFLFSYNMGLNFYPKVLIFEYMPFQVYRKCHTILHACFWLFVFFNVIGFATMRIYFPSFATFTILALLSYLGLVFCYFFVVEPKGKSLIQVQLEIGGNPIGRRGALYNQTKIIV